MAIELTQSEKNALDKYAKVYMTKKEVRELKEYSLSNPTQSGNVGIKKWVRRTPVKADFDDAIWFLGEIKDNQIIFSHIIFKDGRE